MSEVGEVLWAGRGTAAPLTKRDPLRYMVRVSPWLLPHLAGRPLFVTRYPDGVAGKSFSEKHWDNPPGFARNISIYSSHTEGDGSYLICETSRRCSGYRRWPASSCIPGSPGWTPSPTRGDGAGRSPALKPRSTSRCSTTRTS